MRRRPPRSSAGAAALEHALHPLRSSVEPPHVSPRAPPPRRELVGRESAGAQAQALIERHLVPDRSGLSAAEAAAWLFYCASRLNPAKNQSVLERILEKLRTEGRFVTRTGTAYRLDLEDE